MFYSWEMHLTKFFHLRVIDRWWGRADLGSRWPGVTKDQQTRHEPIIMTKIFWLGGNFIFKQVTRGGQSSLTIHWSKNMLLTPKNTQVKVECNDMHFYLRKSKKVVEN